MHGRQIEGTQAPPNALPVSYKRRTSPFPYHLLPRPRQPLSAPAQAHSNTVTSPSGSLELAFNMDEAAKLLRISRRSLQEIVKRHPFYYPNGRRKLFQESDIANLREAMRSEANEDRQRIKTCLSNLSHRATARRRITPSEGPISGPIWTEAQKRLTALQQQSA